MPKDCYDCVHNRVCHVLLSAYEHVINTEFLKSHKAFLQHLASNCEEYRGEKDAE